MPLTTLAKDPSPGISLFDTAPIPAPAPGTSVIASLQWNNLIDILEGTSADKIVNAALATNPLARANHTGTQLKSTISDFAHTHPKSEIDDAGAWLDSEIPSLDTSKIATGRFIMARLASGAPDGTKFIRDDGVLATPTASVNIKETEIDFGASGKQNKSFTITDADVVPGSQIIAVLSFKAAAGQQADEAEMEAENLHFTCKAGTGQFTLYGAVKTGTVQRKYLVNYLVG